MTAGMREEMRVGQLAIRFLVESGDSNGAVAVFEFDVPAGANVPVAHSHDGYEETIYGLAAGLTRSIEGTPADVGPGRDRAPLARRPGRRDPPAGAPRRRLRGGVPRPRRCPDVDHRRHAGRRRP